MWHSSIGALGVTSSHIYYELFSTQRLVQDLAHHFSAINIKNLSQTIQNDHWVREVHICTDNTPLVYAKTIIPESLYLLHRETLDGLSNAAIGANFLYKQNFTRSSFEYCIQNNNLCRKSTFNLESHKVLLFEDFIHIEFNINKFRW